MKNGLSFEACEPAPPSVPDFELIKRIGGGSYGDVWLGRSLTAAWRAVKIVRHPMHDDSAAVCREFEGLLEYEQIAAGHPGLVRVMHTGHIDKATIFYVMELADDLGGLKDPNAYQPDTLEARMKNRGRFEVADSLDVAISLVDALCHLHASGKVHRDIKPSNVVFVHGRPKLADIGLVADIQRCGSFVGTEGYVPPEGPGSPQADLYAVGMLMYEMVTGRDRLDFPEMPDVSPDWKEAGDFRLLNDIILRACHADRGRRYESAAELLADLNAMRERRRLPSVSARRRRLARRAACVLALGGLVLLAGAATGRLRRGTAAKGLARRSSIGPTPSADGWPRETGDDQCMRVARVGSARRLSRPALTERWTLPGDVVLAGDVTGDGRPDAVIVSGRRLSVVSADGTVLWTRDMPQPSASLGVLHDVNGDNAPDIGVSWTDGDKAFARFYDGLGREIKTLSISFPDVEPSFAVEICAVLELLPGEGKVVLATARAAYPLRPRGLACIDWESGALLWFTPLAQFIRDVAVEDMTMNARREIVVSTYAPGNGAVAGGLDDMASYVHLLDANGKVRWSRKLGGMFTGNVLAVADMDLSNRRVAVVATYSAARYLKEDAGKMVILSHEGHVLVEKAFPASMGLDHVAVGDFVKGRADRQILCGSWDGHVRLFASDLTILRETFVGEEAVVHAVSDMDGDGTANAVVTTADGSLLILAPDLTVLCGHRFPVSDRNRRLALADLDGDGVNDVLLAAAGRVTLFALVEGSPRSAE